MGNNPTLTTQIAQPEKKDMSAVAPKVKAVYGRFSEDLSRIRREHRQQIDVILKTINERKIKDLKEKLKNI